MKKKNTLFALFAVALMAPLMSGCKNQCDFLTEANTEIRGLESKLILMNGSYSKRIEECESLLRRADTLSGDEDLAKGFKSLKDKHKSWKDRDFRELAIDLDNHTKQVIRNVQTICSSTAASPEALNQKIVTTLQLIDSKIKTKGAALMLKHCGAKRTWVAMQESAKPSGLEVATRKLGESHNPSVSDRSTAGTSRVIEVPLTEAPTPLRGTAAGANVGSEPAAEAESESESTYQVTPYLDAPVPLQ